MKWNWREAHTRQTLLGMMRLTTLLRTHIFLKTYVFVGWLPGEEKGHVSFTKDGQIQNTDCHITHARWSVAQGLASWSRFEQIPKLCSSNPQLSIFLHVVWIWAGWSYNLPLPHLALSGVILRMNSTGIPAQAATCKALCLSELCSTSFWI